MIKVHNAYVLLRLKDRWHIYRTTVENTYVENGIFYGTVKVGDQQFKVSRHPTVRVWQETNAGL